jgi:hypothetical protein
MVGSADDRRLNSRLCKPADMSPKSGLQTSKAGVPNALPKVASEDAARYGIREKVERLLSGIAA